MRKVLLVSSDKNELKGFPVEMERCICGVGPIQSAAYTSMYASKNRPDVIFSIGSAGAVSGIEKGSVVSFSSVVTPDQNLESMHISLGKTIGADRATFSTIYTFDRKSPYTLLTSGTFNKEKRDYHALLHADAADMEAYGVGMAAKILGIRFYAVKLITDTLGDNSSVGDILFSYREGRERVIEKVLSLLQEEEGE